ncbi:glutamate receptor ionotropic, delta-2-like [Procambarus clarkii]|uniref:glutamate receptor ionotropic, delta-2-like n=1 Tax=Procambarus clarkii TaxID=6728 RepID=UPI003744323F
MAKVLELLADTTNFTYTHVRPPDGIWGSQQNDGSWSGMVGMVSRQEVDIGLGPFAIDAQSAAVVDFTWPVTIEYIRILGGRGRAEVDPWGFLFPLDPLVWASILGALLVLPLAVFLMSSCTSIKTPVQFMDETFNFTSLILNQGISVQSDWWWERVVLAVWGLVTVVLTQSYAGNLMALLAVTNIPQPFQSLHDIVDDHSVTLLVQSGAAKTVYITTAKVGILRDVADLQQKNRLKFIKTSEFVRSINTLVRNGHYLLISEEVLERAVMARDFSRKGQCDFYLGREGFLPLMYSLAFSKGNCLVPVFSKRITMMLESGLYNHWVKTTIPNFTACDNLPTKIVIQASLSVADIWGMFFLLACGLALSLFVLCLELLYNHVHQ